MPKALLFDLDGTLLDTAPDLANALNHVLIAQKKLPLDLATIRPVASNGSAGLLKLGFGIHQDDLIYTDLQRGLLDFYAAHIADQTILFPGMLEILRELEQQHIPWGIVTNKPAYLTKHLLRQLNLDQRAACVISGDTLAQKKPHPAPLLHAAALLKIAPQDCWYVGDAERDILAGKSAGMYTIAALYGYIDANTDPRLWAADDYLSRPADLYDKLQPALKI